MFQSVRISFKYFALLALTICFYGCQNKHAISNTSVTTPITHMPFWRDEGSLFGYKSSVAPAAIAFDAANRPYVRDNESVVTLNDNQKLKKLNFTKYIKEKYPNWNGYYQQGSFSESHIVFDAADHAYMLVNASRSNLHKVFLLYSTDNCITWQVYPLCSGDHKTFVNIEHRDGNSELNYPPAIIIGSSGWGKGGMYLITMQKKEDNTLTIAKPVTVTDDAFIIPVHSGGGNIAVSVKEKIHLFWANGTTIKGKEYDGTPQYCRSYNRKTGKLTKTVFLGFGGTGKPDNHNLPSVSVDSKGFLHVLLGAHHDQFKYLKSLEPNSVVDGWTKTEKIGTPRVGSSGSYTYIGLVCDQKDNLHSIARWAGDGYFFRLVYLQKKSGEEWGQHKVLVSPFKNMYSCWYHKMSIDRRNRIFCNYTYFGGQLNNEQAAAYCQKYPYRKNYWVGGAAGKGNPAIIMTDNQGENWQLATLETSNSNTPLQLQREQIPVFESKNSRHVQFAGQLGGSVHPGEVVGNRMFLGIGARVVVMDIANPAKPKVLTQSLPVKGHVRCVTVKGKYIYAGVDKKLMVFKLDCNNKPILLLSKNVSDYVIKVATFDKYLISTTGNSLAIFDITQPAELKEVIKWSKTEAYDFEIRDNLLYLAAGNDGIYIFDFKAPEKMCVTGSIPANGAHGSSFSIALKGNYLYTGPASCGIALRICDISNPKKPKEISILRRSGWSWGRKVIIKDNIAYYPAPGFIYLLDISNPTAIKELGKVPASKSLRQLLADKKYLYGDAGVNGMPIYDISDKMKPNCIARYSEPICPWGIAVAGSMMLLTDWKNGLYLLDNKQSDNPVILGRLKKEIAGKMKQKKSMFRAAMKGKYVYLATGSEGLWIIDISKPENMQVIKKINFEDDILDVIIARDKLFLAGSNANIHILDINNLEIPKTIKTINTDYKILSLAVNEEYLFAGTTMWNGASHIIAYDLDTLDKSGMVLDYSLGNDVWGLEATNQLLYAAQAEDGISVIDISCIKSPSYVETLVTNSSVFDIAIANNMIYFANGKSGMSYTKQYTPQIPKGAVCWYDIVRQKTNVRYDILLSEGVNPHWKNTAIAMYDIKDQLLFPVFPESAGQFTLHLGTVAGEEFQAFDVYLNGHKLGTVKSEPGPIKHWITKLQTPTISQHGNYLKFVPKAPGKIGLFYLYWEPNSWQSLTQWNNANLATENWIKLHEGYIAETFLFQPVCKRNIPIQFQANGSSELFVNGKLILQTQGAEKKVITIPYKDLNTGINHIQVKMSSANSPCFKLSVSAPDDIKLLTDIPAYFNPNLNVDNWPKTILKNSDLEITVALPDLQKGYYRSCRFEHAGMTTSMKYKGIEFTQNNNENRNPTQANAASGIAEEFSDPIRYDQVKAGEQFLKLGVGLFIKPIEEKYSFNSTYWPVKLFSWTYEIYPDSVRFKQEVNEPDGIAYTYEKTLKIHKNKAQLIIEHKLINRGSIPLNSYQYCHNFTTINKQQTGPGLEVIYSTPVNLQPPFRPRSDFELKHNTFTFSKLQRPFFSRLVPDHISKNITATVINKKLGKGIRYSNDFTPAKMTLYCGDFNISPEFFVRINIPPGKNQQWTRTCTFFERD